MQTQYIIQSATCSKQHIQGEKKTKVKETLVRNGLDPFLTRDIPVTSIQHIRHNNKMHYSLLCPALMLFRPNFKSCASFS